MFSPIVILLVGIVSVIGLIVFVRLNPFLSLLLSAILVSLISPGEMGEKITRVADAFGTAAGKIGIVIALAAVVGRCLIESGAADRIVRAFLSLLGEKRSGAALLGSGFVLSIPVFVDTVFFLLIPLARSLRRQSGKNYLLYLLALACGGMLTHTLVPPTPGPLIMAETLEIDLGAMIVCGIAVGFPASLVGLFLASRHNRRYNIPLRPAMGDDKIKPVERPSDELPGIWVSIAPILLPVALISANTIVRTLAPESAAARWTGLLGNANMAMLFSAILSMIILVRVRRLSLKQLGSTTEEALVGAGMIILITAAGGAFGSMLRHAGLQQLIEGAFEDGIVAGIWILWLLAGFLVSALMKTAQGSTTVALITTSALFAGIGVDSVWLGCHPVYLAAAIGSGGLVGSWMNDSAFWIFSRMGGLTELETLRSYTVVMSLVGLSAFVMTLIYAWFLPFV
jgi:gluconate:H+ symporter, GntP family